jgi:16S rRNA processing protein RimM
MGQGTQTETSVQEAWLHDGRLVLKLAGTDTIEQADRLRGWELTVPQERRAPLAEGEVYLTDLVGCRLADEATGRPLGVVDGWQELPGGILLTSGSLLVPFVKAICKQVNVARREILVDLPAGLEDLNSP